MPNDDTIATMMARLSFDGAPRDTLLQAIRMANEAELGWAELLEMIERVEQVLGKSAQELTAPDV